MLMIDLEALCHSGRLYGEHSDTMPSTGSKYRTAWIGMFLHVLLWHVFISHTYRIVVALIWIMSWIISQTSVFERDFSLQDPLISHPHRTNTSVYQFPHSCQSLSV